MRHVQRLNIAQLTGLKYPKVVKALILAAAKRAASVWKLPKSVLANVASSTLTTRLASGLTNAGRRSHVQKSRAAAQQKGAAVQNLVDCALRAVKDHLVVQRKRASTMECAFQVTVASRATAKSHFTANIAKNAAKIWNSA